MTARSAQPLSSSASSSSPMSSLIDRPVRYDLAESTSPALTVGDLIDPAVLRDLPLGYGTSPGDAKLRTLIGADLQVSADEVLVTAGSIEAMFLVAQTVCGPGDRIVVATPCFPPARTVPEELGLRVDAVPMAFDEGYRLPVERIADALTPQTRLVSLASPQNPSGVRFRGGDLADLLGRIEVRAPDAVVLVDETYREAAYGDDPVPPSYAAASPRVLTCSSLSKAHGAPGLRIGWLTATDPALYERLRDAKFRTAIACSNVDEYLATQLLRRRTEILRPRARRLRSALDELLAWVRDHPLEIVVPDAGALCCLRMPADRFGEDAVARAYARLDDLDTRVAPGSWFGEQDRVFRLGFGHLPPADFTAALDRLGRALEA